MKKNLIGGLALSGGIISSGLVSALVMTSMLMSSSLLISGCQVTDSEAKAANHEAQLQQTVAKASFENTQWQLSEIAGEKVLLQPQQKPINMTFSEQGVAGFSGCNRFNGGYKTSNDAIEFLPMMSTRMACHDDDNREMKFFMTLDKVKHFNVAGKQLKLQADDKQTLMVLTAVN